MPQPDSQLQPGTKPQAKPPHTDTLPLDEPPTTGDFVPQPDDSNVIPAAIGIYKIERLLGQGGMGAIYLAEDPTLQRKVALKVMKAGFAKHDTARERFLREARAAAKVESDHIIRVYQVGEDRGMPFIAMEYLKGKPMDAWMKDARPTVKQVLRIAREAALGLAAAHKAGLIHRDIKPANLWLEAPAGRVKILDFGLARPVSEDTHLTKTGVVVGTPAYMSPEQGRGKEIDHRSDIFSLGCVLYHLATGKRPFSGSNTFEIIANLIAETPEPPSKLNPQIPQALSDAIMQMLEKDAAKRPDKARSVAEAMVKIQRDLDKPLEYVPLPVAMPMPTTGGTTTVWDQLDDSGSEVFLAPDAVSQPVRVRAKPAKKSRLPLIAACAGLVLALGVGVWLAKKDRKAPAVPVAEEPPKPGSAAQPIITPKEVKPAIAGANPPLDPEWVKRVENLPFANQVAEVEKEIRRRNPGFETDGVFQWIDATNRLNCYSTRLKDISPLKVLKGIKELQLGKKIKNNDGPVFRSELSDITALDGLPLTRLWLSGTQVRDLSALRNMPNQIQSLEVEDAPVSDLKAMAGKSVNQAFISGSLINSAESLKDLNIVDLYANYQRIEDLYLLPVANMRSLFAMKATTDLSFLRNSQSIRHCWFDDNQIKRNVALLRSMTWLEKINQKPVTEFWKEWDAKNGFPPLPAGWVERVKNLTEAEQLAEIKAEIINRNPGFEKDGLFEVSTNGRTLQVVHPNLKDISPLAALTRRNDLSFIKLSGVGGRKDASYRCELENIEALENVPLKALNLDCTKVVDLTPIRNHRLIRFDAANMDLRDLSLLSRMPIQNIYINPSKVDDLSFCKELPLIDIMHAGAAISSLEPLRGKKMRRVYVENSKDIKDISLLLGMPLEEINLDINLLKANLPILETLRPTLKTINNRPAEEFWKSVEGKK